jgi:hypothetical protein
VYVFHVFPYAFFPLGCVLQGKVFFSKIAGKQFPWILHSAPACALQNVQNACFV